MRLLWQSGRDLVALLLWRGGRCREIKIKVNVWTVRRDKKRGRCGEVAVSGGSTVLCYNLF